MDMDLSFIKEDWNAPNTAKWEGMDVSSRDGFFFIRKLMENLSDDPLSISMNFIKEIEIACPEICQTASTIEIAYYFNVSEHAYFSSYYSTEFLAFLSERKINLRVIGYPCEDE